MLTLVFTRDRADQVPVMLSATVVELHGRIGILLALKGFVYI